MPARRPSPAARGERTAARGSAGFGLSAGPIGLIVAYRTTDAHVADATTHAFCTRLIFLLGMLTKFAHLISGRAPSLGRNFHITNDLKLRGNH